MNAGTIF